MGLPLEGIRVVDLTVVWAGPHATMYLADWGAEVIRLEPIQTLQPNTRGHMVRVPPEMPRLSKIWGSAYPGWDPGNRPWNRYPIFQSHARNKLSATLDLRTADGHRTALELLSIADVFIENNVPETIEKLGLTYEDIVKVRPDIIQLRMPAYGLTGPYKNYRSFGVQLEGTAGHTWVRGYPDTDPAFRDDVYIGDAGAGACGAFAVISALRHRRRTGKGQLIELSQAESFASYLSEAITDYTMNGRVHSTLGNRHPTMAPNGVYPCLGDDCWVTISVGSDAQWRALLSAMGDPSWAAGQRFVTALGRWKHQDDIDVEIAAWTRERDPLEVMKLLQANGIAAAPVLKEADLYADPQMEHLGYFQTLTHVDTGTHRYPGIMWAAENTPNAIRTPPCLLGEHNDYVYQDLLAYPAAEYDRLVETGQVGTEYASHLP